MPGYPRDYFSGVVRQFSLGYPETYTIAAGVLTIPAGESSYVRVVSETGTTDQLDTITVDDVKPGDILVLEAASGHTITVDDANIDLGGATRVLTSVGQYLTLVYNGAGWSELAYAAGDNV
jgi:hypothetical protein